jgi:hypothetical protein
MKYLSILLICLPGLQSNVANWGVNGHRIVAKICYDNLTEKAQKAVDEELGDNYFAQVANWPDYIKSEKGWDFAESWHYTTISPDQTLAQSAEEYAKDPKVNDIIEGIQLMEAILKNDPAATNTLQSLMDKNKVKPLAGSIKATALAFLLHFIGDIHQPMHVGKNRDLGGNKISVLFFSERMNLHSVWDTHIIEQEKLSFTEFSAFIVKHTHTKKAAWENTSVMEWAEESIITREKIYNTLYNYTDRDSGLPSFSYQYQHDFLPVVEERLGAAGYRAAAMLNAIFK